MLIELEIGGGDLLSPKAFLEDRSYSTEPLAAVNELSDRLSAVCLLLNALDRAFVLSARGHISLVWVCWY